MVDKGLLLVGSEESTLSLIKERLFGSGFSEIKNVTLSDQIEDLPSEEIFRIVLIILDDMDISYLSGFVRKIEKSWNPLIFFMSTSFNPSIISLLNEYKPSGLLSSRAEGAEIRAQIELAFIKRSEEAELNNYRERYEALFNHSLDCILIFDFQGRNLDANSATLKLLGYSEKEFLERTIYEIVEKDDYGCIDNEINEVRENQRKLYPKIIKLRDRAGKRIFVVATYSVILKNDLPFAIQVIAHNVTDKWNAGELKRALFEDSVDPIIIIDLNDRIIAANKTVETVLGYSPEELVNKPFPDEMRLDKDIYEQIRHILLRGEGIPGYETRRRTKSGEILNMSITISPIRDFAGEISSIAFSYRNTTEYKLAEEKLAYQAMLLENVGDAIIATDEKLNINTWNSAAQRIYSLSNNEVIGKNLRDIIFPRFSRLATDSKLKEAFLDSSNPMEAIYRRKSGEEIIVEGNTIELKDKDGNITGYVNVSRNVTDRNRALQALKQSEEKFRAIFENSPLGIIITVNLIIVQVNRAFMRMFGYEDTSELLGKNSLILASPDVSKGLSSIAEERMKGGEVPSAYETYGMKKDGSVFPLYLEAAFLNLPEGRASVTFVTDFTEVKAREGQIRYSLTEKEMLLKEIHHRVKNNLQIISSLLSLQSEYIQDEQALRMFNESRDRIKTMALLHEKLYQSKNFSKINFEEYVNELVVYISRTYQMGNIAVDLEINVENINLSIDTAIPCGLIISELVTNSYKYAYSGLKNGRLMVTFKKERPEYYCLSVYDNGPGFPENIDISRTNTLGLQIVYSLVCQLNGKIELKRGNGNLFLITFPLG